MTHSSDLERLADDGADLTSAAFLQPFGLTADRRRALEKSWKTELQAVLRKNAPVFHLDLMPARFEKLWRATA